MTELTPVEAAEQVTAFLDALDQHLADYPTAVREAGYIATPTWADVALTAPTLRALAAHAYATGAPCDGQRCERGGAAHCHRCAEVEADKLLAERDQLRARLAAVRAATEEWHAFALEHRDDPDHAAQAAWRAMAHALCCVLTAHDGEPADALPPLGVVEFPQDITDEEMTRWAAAWEAAQGPERPLTLDLGNRTATFRAKPWPAEYDADAVARETAEQTPHSEGPGAK